ncbi:MAG: hypothetical protein ACXAAH_15605 [Promethearchaeota archaeon]|jgi:hypothetical protein
MSDLNAIEEQLKKKCGKEIKTIVETFINDVKDLDKKYSNGINSYYIKQGSGSEEKSLYYGGASSLQSALERTLRDTFGQRMLRHKSKELLDKLDVLS